MSGLKGHVEAYSGDVRLTAEARGGREGRYAASLTLPSAGDWTLVIHNGFGRQKVKLLPIHAAAAGTSAQVLTASARGERLFVAKGCVTCHVDIEVGPRLEGRRFDTKYLAEFLADPKPTANLRRDQSPMPNLGLKGPEIASLVSYLQGGSVGNAGGRGGSGGTQ
jgi:mono/diheme cytochrome c family protein